MADEPSDFSDIEQSRALLADSTKSLRGVLKALDILEARMTADETISQSDLARVLTAIAQNRGRVNDDMRKHEDRILFDKKLVANAPLDFDQLRSDIGRKVDRLREALRTEDVSEEP